ncbi:MAG: hypothetical protein AB1744_15820, partial [Candidatus Zixiibacteriota bacterium]
MEVEAVDDCGNADRCTVRVIVYGNHPPEVTTAEDSSVSFCEPEKIYFDVSVHDPDYDPLDVTVNYGTYMASTGRVAFTPDTSGVYTIIVTAVDTCGAVGADTTVVSVHINEPPIVDLGPDTSVYLCTGNLVCLDVLIEDYNLRDIYTSRGEYDSTTGRLCFTAEQSDGYVISVIAVDSCDEWDQDTVIVDVTLGEPPYVHLGPDFNVKVCEGSDVCVPVATLSTYRSLTTNLGHYNPNTRKVCFTPDTTGVYILIVEVTDLCDSAAADTVNITVGFTGPPQVSGLRDSTLYLCLPQEICLSVTIEDPDNDIDSIWS